MSCYTSQIILTLIFLYQPPRSRGVYHYTSMNFHSRIQQQEYNPSPQELEAREYLNTKPAVTT